MAENKEKAALRPAEEVSRARSGAQETRILESEQLLQDDSQVLIKHGETLYRLQRTKENKLILTK
ncbi:hemin uptake protein HemP [Thiomicrorhabdus cannonii]|uniref:hemin uptake protein HemP n=1 Tax=Thiomicrorhabdus cannonii TaxID=2748011 RepID=UPI0015BB8AFF|nr:hemin uptake protein HemP [Thiomicrorhabdus cannonii]